MNSMYVSTPAALVLLALSGCAANAPKADPFETINRVTYKVNDTLDRAFLEPVARGYQGVTPSPVRAGIANAFTNVGEVVVSLNNLLQGKPAEAASDLGRFLVNSTLGILGLFDVATPMGLEKHDEDFGQTLGKWGVSSGPFLVIPFMGPTTVRDGTGRWADSYLRWNRAVDHVPTRNTTYAIETLDLRAGLLGASKTLEEAALDKYQFLRDAYLQRRLRAVHDGKAPREALEKLEEDLEPSKAPMPVSK